MIFRRTNDPIAASRKNAPAANRPYDARREPPLTAGRPQTSAPSLAAPPQQPVSPIAVANARRTQQSNPANTFSGKDQSRKLTVGRDISLNGEIATCDHLIVEGHVRATIKGGKILEISESGTYEGIVDIEQADIAGRFDGELVVRGKLIIRPTAHVTGALYYNRLQVDTGASINAQLNTLVAEAPQQPAEEPQQQAHIQHTPVQQTTPTQQGFSLSSLNDEPGFLRANGA